jgi:hypothetical protein
LSASMKKRPMTIITVPATIRKRPLSTQFMNYPFG